MSRQDRSQRDHNTPLMRFLRRILGDRRITQAELASVAEVSESVLSGWLAGAYPAERVVGVKRICDHFGESLSVALTGLPDKYFGSMEGSYMEEAIFDGIARIKIERLVPRKKS